jgi:hypothetical protein
MLLLSRKLPLPLAPKILSRPSAALTQRKCYAGAACKVGHPSDRSRALGMLAGKGHRISARKRRPALPC